MIEIPKIFADFNNADRHGRVRLNTNGFFAGIKESNLELSEGMQILLHDDDSLKTLGLLRYSHEENIWVAEINWDAIK